ncbi:FadR/GntR family transcriptional regulator [Kribbella sp. CA-293567]|uniref:FadR/GntR family transcriptional regulator n=1 Tax=Kribbella sp. CA-293567 TaxID=3002436 RepID=UPI0022DD746F|nr:FCD domain-containing protein [Kribbella sp. CA-293567]WBQ03686.1 GntR family transcriptional regulator [Kribbella sp. CA-293567]
MTYSTVGAAPSLSDRLTEAILGIIREADLGPGDAIPSARELAKRFDITTPTIREALRKLEATGAVEFRHGSGTYVGPTINNVVLANPHRPPITKESVLQLIGARLLIEPAVAAQAAAVRAGVAGTRSLERLEAAVTNALTPPGGPAFALNFHVELAAASGNPVVEELIGSLLKVRLREQQQIRQLYDNRKRDYEEHRAIFEAVQAGDAAAAEQLTRAHLDHIRLAVEAAEFLELP